MERANDLYSTILTGGPSPSTLLLICRKMKEEGRVNEAVRACIKGLSVYPDDIRLRWLLSECYLELGFFSMAEKEIAIVAEQIETLAPVFKIQADLFERQERRKEAYAALEKYLVHFSGDSETMERLRSLKPEEETSPTQAPSPEKIVPEIATHTLAEIYESQGQFQAAIDTYKRLMEQDPGDLRARDRLRELEVEVHGEEKIVEHPERRHNGTDRMIGILEGWLSNIREMANV